MVAVWGGEDGCEHIFDISVRRQGDKSGPHGPASDIGAKAAQDAVRRGEPSAYCSLCGAWRGQLGLEPTWQEYISHLCECAEEWWRVLKPTGNLFVNLGDSYSSGQASNVAEYISDIDAAWLAAIADTDGSLQIHKQNRGDNSPAYQPYFSVSMIDRVLLDRICRVSQKAHVWEWAKTSTGKQMYQWGCRGQQLAPVLRRIYPYLVIKKRQAALLIALADHLSVKRPRPNHRLLPEVLEQREAWYRAVRKLNARESPESSIPRPNIQRGVKAKQKMMIPARFALALQEAGWVLRDLIIWYKGKEYPDGKITKVAMPESVKDRMSCSYEMLFHFVKEPKGYFFDLDAIRKPHIYGAAKFNIRVRDIKRGRDKGPQWKATEEETALYDEGQQMKAAKPSAGANPGDVWIIQPEPFKEKHYACWPSKLCEMMIKVGCPKEVCPKCGKPRERLKKTLAIEDHPLRENRNVRNVQFDGQGYSESEGTLGKVRVEETIGWSDCQCGEGFVPGVIVDPFFGGSWRLARVALNLGRNVIGVDMKEEYLEMAKDISIYGEKELSKERERREKTGMSQGVLL